MQANLAKALSYIFISEGGFAVRASEPGGAVNMGVSMQTFANWRRPQPVTIDDLRQMTVAEATQIYNSMFASHVSFAMLPSGLDYCVLDASVNEGVAASILFLSLSLQNLPVSANGPCATFADALSNVLTINLTALKAQLLPMIKTADLASLINWICDNRLVEKRKRAMWAEDGPGWTNRVEYVRANSLGMLS